MKLLPELKKDLDRLADVDVEKLKVAAVAMEDAGLNADEIWNHIADLEEGWHDTMLAMQELKDGNF